MSSGELKPLIYMISQIIIIKLLDKSRIESVVLIEYLMSLNCRRDNEQLRLLAQGFSNLNVHGSS